MTTLPLHIADWYARRERRSTPAIPGKGGVFDAFVTGLNEYTSLTSRMVIEVTETARIRENQSSYFNVVAFAPSELTVQESFVQEAIEVPGVASGEILNRLPISQTLVQRFLKSYNGKGLSVLTTWLVGGRITALQAEVVLADAVEDALIGVYFGLSKGRAGTLVEIKDRDMPLLHAAIEHRIPRVEHAERRELAKCLSLTVCDTLSQGEILLIDGASVSLQHGCIFISPHEATAEGSERANEPRQSLAA